MFRKWALKVERNIKNKNYNLKKSCKRLIYWAGRIKEKDTSYYDEIRDYEISLISKSIPIIYDDYHKTYLLKSTKHGKFTKARQKKIGSFIYNFNSFLLPLAEEIKANDFLKEKIQAFIKEYLTDLFFNLSNVPEHELDALLETIFKAEELEIKNTGSIRETIENEILVRQLEDEVEGDSDGESVQVEFKEKVPDDLLKLCRTIAAFASTEGGRIYLGIKDDGKIVGLKENKPSWLDKLQLRIEDIVYNNIKPTPTLSMNLYEVGNKYIVQIKVPKGLEPIYFFRNKPYIRRLTATKPATPSDVKRLHLRHFIRNLESSAG